ncbi:MAG: multidrug efflux protein [Deltaproteobacteria bacterium HGW-Deltaproteobacteria-6]|jgi:multidrug efflux pump|nr:MAG: multidrug efflux protein [Deltaproteobacteria bacterium HGW-Deltaproteobacteria-6]
MKFTDLFIKRPVLATVLSLLILVLGLRSISLLPVREYPQTQNAVVKVTTVYTGADPELVSGFITTPLENSIAQANGINYLTSTSTQGMSTITANMRLNYDANVALSEINTKINAVLNQLPKAAQQPVITISTGENIGSMIFGFYSKDMPPNSITDYLIRVVQPKLQAVEGVQTAEILGKQEYALRAWLDPDKMAAYGLTATDVTNALTANNFIAALGRTQGQMVTVDLTAATGLHTVAEFRKLVIKSVNGAIIRMEDVAHVTLGADSYDMTVRFDGKAAVFMSIKVAPNANLLSVCDRVAETFPAVASQLPKGLEGKIVYDATDYVDSSIKEVVETLIQALLIVTLVIFLSLGSVRSVLIPTVAIPLSLVGTFVIMAALGYTINLMTLLALVLAIGLVVDDAIIVVENVQRHMEEGAGLLQAAVMGARELAGPIIAMTVVLIAVYLPIGFMGGLTGALFTEFAYTLAGAVFVSAVVALTLSPMMCSRFLKAPVPGEHHRFTEFIDRQFNRLRSFYTRLLRGALGAMPVVMVFAAIILASNYFLFANSKSELAPQDDQGFLMGMLTAAPDATLQQTQLYSLQLYDLLKDIPEIDHLFQVEGFTGLNSGFTGVVLKPWDKRQRTIKELQPEMQNRMGRIAGGNGVIFPPPPLPGSGEGLPVQFVIGTTDSFTRLDEVSQAFLQEAQKSGLFMYVDTDLKINKPQTTLEVDRDKAAQMGLTMQDVGAAMASMLGGGYVNYFSMSGRSYKVIPQVRQSERLTEDQLMNYQIKTASGASIPVSTFATLKTTVVPASINHFQQLNSSTISGILTPGITLGQALTELKTIAGRVLPEGYSVDYAGESRQYIKESSALLVTFAFAMIIIFLCLAALFESFRDPVIVLVSVPMSICGALIFISLGIGDASLNIYTQVGLVTLIGLISKHGILIVQFANDLQREGKTKREAIELAAATRLRPILMTTAAMVLGVMPLVMATGAGAAGRYNMGLVITTGIAIGTLFTLFVVPAMYLLMAHNHQQKADPEKTA